MPYQCMTIAIAIGPVKLASEISIERTKQIATNDSDVVHEYKFNVTAFGVICLANAWYVVSSAPTTNNFKDISAYITEKLYF